jgi:hypothetical protein
VRTLFRQDEFPAAGHLQEVPLGGMFDPDPVRAGQQFLGGHHALAGGASGRRNLVRAARGRPFYMCGGHREALIRTIRIRGKGYDSPCHFASACSIKDLKANVAAAASERFDHREDHDADEQQCRDLVEDAVPALRVRISIGRKLLDQGEAGAVVTDDHEHEHEFELQPVHQ